VGTQGGGLNRLKDQKFALYSTSEGLSSDAIWSIYEDPRGRLWLGTLGEGVNMIDGPTRTTYRARDGFPSDNVWSMLETRDGALWLGSRGQGLARWKDGKFQTFTARNGLVDDVVLALLEDRGGDLWIGTSGGLSRYRGGKFETFTPKDGLGSSKILCLAEDGAGDLWVGTRGGGIARRREGRFERLGVAEGLSDATVYDVHPDGTGRVWFGTAGKGLLTIVGGRLRAYTSRDGLFDDLIYRILEDDAGDFWMSCNRGVFRVARRDLEAFEAGRIPKIPSISYGTADGLKSPECNGGFQPAGWKTRDGRLWFPTLRGAAVIDPARLRSNRVEPPVVVEEAFSDSQRMARSGTVRLPPGRSRFEFRYTALSFAAPEKVVFRYRLEGFDHDWVDAGPRRTAFYTNLPSGDFRFRVVARNDDGVWNERGSSYAFSIAPRYYQTVWFYVLCSIAVGLAAEGATILRVRHLKARQKGLEDLVAERTRQLEEANRGLERLSLLDPLTGIANRRHFERVLEFERKRSDRTGASLGLLMIDIDNFKSFNDALGHVAGDACLKAVVEVLAGSMRGAGDLLARYGGEEFAVVMPGAGMEGAIALGERLRAGVEALDIPGTELGDARHVTISVGAAATEDARATSAEDLVSAADRALYEAKQTGRNRVVGSAWRPSSSVSPGPRV
jgi:diguanylate cyclase (GGDEF)-like protein